MAFPGHRNFRPTQTLVVGLALAGAAPADVGSQITDPERIERLVGAEIHRPRIKQAGAVALTRLADRRYLCAVWREVGGRHQGRVDFHLSRDHTFGGFGAAPLGTWQFTGFGQGNTRDPKYQNINFVTERSAAGGERLFLVATENADHNGAPITNGVNYADLWLVDPAAVSTNPAGALTHVHTREFRGLGRFGNFHAAAGVYVNDAGVMSLYAGYHHRLDRTLRLSEFSGRPTGAISSMQDAWIELYEVEDFRGKRLTINGTRDASLRDYRAIFVEGGDFDEEVSSARFQLPHGATYRLYSAPDFAGPSLDLVGDGTIQNRRDLGAAGIGNRILSSKYL